jgi:hypothetical protein
MDRRIQRLSADLYRAYSMSLLYAVSNRTDGYLTADDLDAVPHFKTEHVGSLVSAGLWTADDAGGWVITDYMTTQTSKAQLEAAEIARAKDADRKARERAAKKASTCSPADSPEDNTALVSNPADRPADNAGQDRTGKDRPSTKSFPKPKIQLEVPNDDWSAGAPAPYGPGCMEHDGSPVAFCKGCERAAKYGVNAAAQAE